MKKYSTSRVVISFTLLLLLPFAALFAAAGIIASFERIAVHDYNYRDLHTFEVVGHSVEKVSDNLCEITLTIKNDSAYTAELADYVFQVNSGEKNISKTCIETFDTNLGYYRQELIVPAGRTVDAHFRVPVQNTICSVLFTYSGMSYNYRDIFGGDDKEKYYLVEVDLT